MAFMIKGIIDLKGILFLMLLTVTSQATNLDCIGKAFHCVNSTHFMICVDLGRGISTTIDDVIIPCPSPTVCRRTNRFECEFPLPFVLSSTVASPKVAAASTESEVTTFAPLPTVAIPFEEYLNTVSTTTLSQTGLQSSPTDIILSVKPITRELDSTSFSVTENVITEKSVLIDAIASNRTDRNFNNSSDINTRTVGKSNLNVIPNNAGSVNNNQGTQITDYSKLNTEYNNLGNLTSSNKTSIRSEQKEHTETDFTTENIAEAVIIPDSTEKPVQTIFPEVSNTEITQKITTEQYSAVGFQDVTDANTIDMLSTLLDTTIYFDHTENGKQISESQLVRDTTNAAGDFNVLNKVSVTTPSIEATSAVPEQTVSIEQYSTNSFQDDNINATTTHYIATLPDTNTPSGSSLDTKQVNTGELDSTILSATENIITKTSVLIDVIPSNRTFTDRNLYSSSDINANTVETSNLNVIPNNADSVNNSESTQIIDYSKLNAEYNNLSNLTLINNTTIRSEQKEHTETVFTTENIAEAVIIPNFTEKPAQAIFSEVSNTEIIQKITTEQYSAVGFQDVTDASTIDMLSTILDTTIYFDHTENVKQISASQLVRDTTNAADNFNVLNEVSVTAPSIDVTSTVPGQTVSIEQYSTNSFQDGNINATTTPYIATLPDTNTSSGSSLDTKQVNTGELDSTILSATENVITEKSVLIDVIPSNRTFTDRNLNNSSDVNANIVVTSDFNVIPNNADFVNNSQSTQITVYSKLNAEYNNLSNLTLSNNTTIRSEQKEHTETVFTTENIAKAVIIPNSTEKPVQAIFPEVSNTEITQKITTEQYSTVGFQDVIDASTIDMLSTLLNTTINFAQTENVKQISESQLVRDTTNAAGDFNVLNEVSVTAPSIDVTSSVSGQTVSIEQYSTNSFQDGNINTTATHYIATLPKTNTPSGSRLDTKQVNTLEHVKDTIKNITVSYSNMNTVQKTSTNIIPTAVSQLNIAETNLTLLENQQSVFGNKTSHKNIMSELTKTTEPMSTIRLVDATSNTLIHTSVSQNTFSTDAITEYIVTEPQIINEPLNATIMDDSAILSVITSTIEQPRNTNASNSINGTIDSGSLSYIETNVEMGETTTNIIPTINELLVGNNLERETPAATAATYMYTILDVIQSNYQANQAVKELIPSNHSLSDFVYLVPTETMKDQNKTDGAAANDITILNSTIILDAVMATDLFNTNENQYPDEVEKNKQEFFTTSATISESQLTTNNLTDISVVTVKAVVQDHLNAGSEKSLQNITSATLKLYPTTERLTTIEINNLEMFLNESTATPTLDMSTENINNNPQSDTERSNLNNSNQVRNITDRQTQNEKVLSNSEIGHITNSILELLPNVVNTPTGTDDMSNNVYSTDSVIPTIESLIAKPAIRNINKVLHNNSSATLIDGQVQTATASLLTPELNVTDSLYTDRLSSVTEGAYNVSTYQYEDIITVTEVSILAHTAIVDTNKSLSLEQYVNNAIATSSSSPAAAIEDTEIAYMSSQFHPFADKTNNFNVTTTYNSNNQSETQTNSVLFTNNTNSKQDKVFSKNIDDTTINTDVFISIKEDANYTKESILKVPKSETTIKLLTNDTKKQSYIISTATPLKYVVRNVSESISLRNTVDPKLLTDKTNAMQRNVLGDNIVTTINNLPDSSIIISDSFQTLTELNYATESIITSEQPIKSLDASHNFSIINAQSSTESSIKTTTNDLISNKNNSNETTNLIFATKSYLDHTENTLENNLSILSGLAENEQNLNAQNSLEIQPSTVKSYASATADIIGIKTDMPVSSEKNANKRTTAMDNNIENVIVNSAKTTKESIGLTHNTTLVPTKINISRATTEININNNHNSTIKDDSVRVTLTNVNSVINPEQQRNAMESDTFKSSSLVASNQESFVHIMHTALHLPVVTIEEVNEVSSTSTASLSDKNIRSTSAINNVESLDTSTIESTFNGEHGHGLTYSTANKEIQFKSSKVDDATETSRPSLVLSVISSEKTSNLQTNQYINAQTNENITKINMMPFIPFLTKSTEEVLPGVATTAQTLLNNDHNKNNIPSADKGLLSVTLPEIANASPIVTTTILTSVTSPIDSDTSLKRKVTTDDFMKATSTLPINAEDLSATAIIPSKPKTTEINIDSTQVSQSHSSHVGGSLVISSISYPFSTDINNQISLKATENRDRITNLEPTIEPTTIKPPGLVTVDNSQVLTTNINTTTNGQILTVSVLRPTETIKRKTNTNIEITYSDKNKVKSPEIISEPTIQITAPGIQNITSDGDNITSMSPVVLKPQFSLGFLNPTELTTSDVLVDNIIASEKTHSGIISIIAKTSKLRESKEKKEKLGTNESEDGEHRINVEFSSLQDENLFTSSTDIPLKSVNEKGIKLQNNIGTKEELLIKTNNKNYDTITENSAHLTTKMNTDKNIHNGTNTTVSGYKEETPTHELIGNSTSSTNDSHTSNNKSQDQNMTIPQAHNKSIISNDQSRTFPYMSQTKAAAAPDTQTTGFPTLESTTRKTDSNNLFCKQKKRGRYADELDCRKFYICLGNKSSHVVEGTCPVNTVFSEINKQCTKNLSHCIRNNQFRCVTEGHFSDFLNDNIYYICIRNNLNQFIRFKLQCQNGYHLNKTSVRCVLNNESTSTTESKNASEQSSSSKNQDTTEKPEKKFKCKKEGVFPDPSNCKKYFECTKVDSSYRQKRKKCDSDEIFHKDKKKCVDSDSNEC